MYNCNSCSQMFYNNLLICFPIQTTSTWIIVSLTSELKLICTFNKGYRCTSSLSMHNYDLRYNYPTTQFTQLSLITSMTSTWSRSGMWMMAFMVSVCPQLTCSSCKLLSYILGNDNSESYCIDTYVCLFLLCDWLWISLSVLTLNKLQISITQGYRAY